MHGERVGVRRNALKSRVSGFPDFLHFAGAVAAANSIFSRFRSVKPSWGMLAGKLAARLTATNARAQAPVYVDELFLAEGRDASVAISRIPKGLKGSLLPSFYIAAILDAPPVLICKLGLGDFTIQKYMKRVWLMNVLQLVAFDSDLNARRKRSRGY